MNDENNKPKRTAPNVKEVECKSMLVSSDKPFVCVHHKEDYFSGQDNYDEIVYHESEISRFETEGEMLKWIEEVEATDVKGYYYGRTFFDYAGEENKTHKEYSD